MSTSTHSTPSNLSSDSNNQHPNCNYGIASWGLFHQRLAPFFDGVTLHNPIASRLSSSLDAVLAWGNKPSSKQAALLARQCNIPLLRVEDGFLYGLEPGSSKRSSLVVDDLGIYYEASQPSRLEKLITADLNAEQITRAQSIQTLWQRCGVSKYNHAPDWVRPLDDWNSTPFILLVDQTHGDQSIAGAQASASNFQVMLDAALAQTIAPNILIKVHPEVVSGKKLGYFDVSLTSKLRSNPRIRILDQDCNLGSVIKEADAVYTVSSQAGFEGLLWGKPAYTFGMPFYAGWGLTQDFYPKPSWRTSATLEQLIFATLVLYSRYLHPETNSPCQIEDLISFFGFQRIQRQRFHQPLYPVALSNNKYRNLKGFVQGCNLVTDARLPEPKGVNLVWGSKSLLNTRANNAHDVIRIEDGFIRSIGLGAALSRPYSWVFDQTGIYYDSNRSSDLESILQNYDFDTDLSNRAEDLRKKIIALGISKYNLGPSRKNMGSLEALREARTEKSVPFLLVIGQVESDASIKLGGLDIQTNADLLKAVRKANPAAFIVYKPHPDIEHAVRFSGKNSHLDTSAFNLLLTNCNLADCLEFIDEVHTISSLAGFEALIRNKPVVCYGLPFYAGWGLTTDRHACNRRTRTLNLPELIAGALILYPTYIHPKSGLYCTPEALIEELSQQIKTKKGSWEKCLNYSKKISMGIIHKLKGI